MSPLPEWHLLVVAAVDGEISHSDRKKLRELIKTNEEARQLLREYRTQAKLLSQAQSPPLPCDFASVFRNEPEFQARINHPLPNPPIIAVSKPAYSNSFALASWVALALSLLLALGVGFALLTRPKDDSAIRAGSPPPNLIGSNTSNPPLSKSLGAKPNPGTLALENGAKTVSESPSAPKISPKTESVAHNAAGPLLVTPSNPQDMATTQLDPDHSKMPKVGEGDQPSLLTAPYSDPGTLVESSISVPTWVSWENPRIPPQEGKAVTKGIFLEIPCNDSMVVSTQLIQILKNQKKGVLVDRLAQDRLVQKNIRSHFGVCLEGISLSDLEKLLGTLKLDVEKSRNKTAIPPLGKGIALFPPDTEVPTVFQFSNQPDSKDKPLGHLSDLAPNPNLAKSPGKPNEGLKKLLQPTLNNQGMVDALVLAQSPYYAEVRSSTSSQEITLYRKLKNKGDISSYRVTIFLRQLHI